MARYRGPRARISRRFNDAVLGCEKVLKKKSYPPGFHGKARKKKSDYGTQLMEKQKVKYMYGMLERQFYNTFKKAVRQPGVTGENLLALLESRLDNVVYRLGIAHTRRFARQLVTHGHIEIDGSKVDIPSFLVKPGMLISVATKSRSVPSIESNMASANPGFSWLQLDRKTFAGKFMSTPVRDEIPENIVEHSIVELYSR